MKKLFYKPSYFLLPALLLSITLSGQEVKKEYHEEYTAGPATTLQLFNKYGDVIIDSWNEDRIVIDVLIKIELPNQDKAQKLLEYLNVEFSQDGDVITAKTVIDEKFNFSGWSGNRKFSIDYSVRMPVESSLTLSNRYGNSDIDEIQGRVNFDIKYGNVNAGIITRGNTQPLSRLNLAYGNCSIDEAGWLDMTLRYAGKVYITKGQALLIDSKYSKLSIDNISSIVGESKYDNLIIGNINNLVLENGYTETKIGTLTKKLDYEGAYGSFSIEEIPSGFESIDVETKYMGVNLGIADDANYKLQAKVSYGGLKYNEHNFITQRKFVENNSHEIDGIIGNNRNPEASVNVSASYGSIRLY
ncbi:MAG TPA: hypothetical protein VHO50_13390 [Bacteroidales bacterium]|nr:hypothetical protein [Bacteroidales bacterium]